MWFPRTQMVVVGHSWPEFNACLPTRWLAFSAINDRKIQSEDSFHRPGNNYISASPPHALTYSIFCPAADLEFYFEAIIILLRAVNDIFKRLLQLVLDFFLTMCFCGTSWSGSRVCSLVETRGWDACCLGDKPKVCRSIREFKGINLNEKWMAGFLKET